MTSVNRLQTDPIQVQRSTRRHDVVALTSMPVGKCVPLAYIPMLREDSLTGRLEINVEMLETRELLMNPVNLRVTAFVVPLLALERFEGSRDQFDRSYMGQPKVEGGAVVPFIETQAMGAHGSNLVYKALGLHAKSTDLVNTSPLEVYNAIWNFRAKNRSPEIAPRARLATTLAPAFWHQGRFEYVVPDFDQAVIDGEVALNVVEARMPVRGIGLSDTIQSRYAPLYSRDSSGVIDNYAQGWLIEGSGGGLGAGEARLAVKAVGDGSAGFPDVWAELQQDGITVSLSNIELAKKTQAFAKLRERYEGFDDEYIIDMLMDGLTIPDQAMKQPILLADQVVRFQQAKRYATDAANLAQSATSGAARTTVSLRVPKLAVGGIVMVLAEVLPEQLFERQRDPWLHTTSVDQLPEYLRDYLDPEKVDYVYNREVDTDHATPNSVFGYAPLNWKWTSMGPRIGGKFYRPTTNTATDDVRQRIYAVETVNPTLASDFYIASQGVHQKPFLDLVSDPFEATVLGACQINGNTVFGGRLVEAGGNYDAVLEKAPTDRIVKP